MQQNPYSRSWSAERPLEGEYLPPGRPPQRKAARGLGAAALALGIVLAKFKSLFLVLLNFKFAFLGLKLLGFAGSFLLSMWFYALYWGWPFAALFVVLILLHELGHVFAMRFFGIPSSLPFFIPGLGALVTAPLGSASPLNEALIAYAGPLVGGLASLACYGYGLAAGQPLFVAAAYTGFFLNLFNLAPVLPLDGGRIVGAVSPRIWIFGLVCFVVAMLGLGRFNPLILILIALSIPQAIAAWRGRLDARYASLTAAQRGTVAVAYFVLAGFLFAMMLESRVAVPGRPFA
jgi:Zn-dependent protease